MTARLPQPSAVTPRTALGALWRRAPFIGRLLAVTGFALVVSAAVMMLVSAREQAREVHERLWGELAGELRTLPSALAEPATAGDWVRIQDILDRYAMKPQLAWVRYEGGDHGRIEVRGPPSRLRAPAWFSRLFGLGEVEGNASVRERSGRGTLTMALSADRDVNALWRRLIEQMGILFLAMLLDFAGLWLVLRSGLAPLTRLEHAAAALAAGQRATWITPQGPRELRHVIEAFNRMNAATVAATERLNRNNADLLRFSEIAAHHLQEPARRLVSFSQRLRRHLDGRIDDADARLSLDFIEQQAGRLRELLHDIELYLAANQPRGVVMALDTADVLDDALAAFRDRIEAVGAAVTIGPLPPIRLDRPRLYDIFSILLDNALAYRAPGRPLRIHISAETVPAADASPPAGAEPDGSPHRVRLLVADNGGGILPEYRERVFRVFERLSPRPGDSGTGIGLSIVRQIAYASGGNAVVLETEGGGTTVAVDLPAAAPPGEAEP